MPTGRDTPPFGSAWPHSVSGASHAAARRAVGPLVIAKVDLRYPEKILRVDIVGPFAALSMLGPAEILSVAKAGR
jgi:tRNA(Ser,Leu) C12 N-acetylase TAN1